MADIHFVWIVVAFLFIFCGLVIAATIFLLNIWEGLEANRRRLNGDRHPKHKK